MISLVTKCLPNIVIVPIFPNVYLKLFPTKFSVFRGLNILDFWVKFVSQLRWILERFTKTADNNFTKFCEHFKESPNLMTNVSPSTQGVLYVFLLDFPSWWPAIDGLQPALSWKCRNISIVYHLWEDEQCRAHGLAFCKYC